MSIGSLSFGSVGAATPLAQSKGSDVDRSQQESAAQEGQLQNDLKAEQAAGIGQTDGDEHEIEERDADGRRPWELARKRKKPPLAQAPTAPEEAPHSRDATGQCGNALDVTG
jgi:hypothetical protein